MERASAVSASFLYLNSVPILFVPSVALLSSATLGNENINRRVILYHVYSDSLLRFLGLKFFLVFE